MKTYLTLTFYFLLLLSACQQKKQTNSLDQTITIDLTKPAESQGPAEEWIDEIQFIPLETNPECYISSRRRYNLNENYIVIGSNKTIHLFNRDGKHLNSFTKQGKGPGEYGMIYDINLIPDLNEIMVIDPNMRKILCYDFSGNMSSEIKASFMPLRVAPLVNGMFACYTGRLNNPTLNNQDLHQIFFLNRDGQIKSKHLPFSYLMSSTGGGGVFSHSGLDGEYFINPAYEFNIYQIGPADEIFIKYKFNFGDYGIDTSMLNDEKIMMSKNPKKKFGDKFTYLDHMAITSNTISFWGPVIKSEIKMGTRQINRKSGNIRFMELDTLSNYGYYSGIPIYFESKSYGDYFIFTVEAINMIETLNKLSLEQKKTLSKSKGFNKLATLKEDDNPVLVLYKVKDF